MGWQKIFLGPIVIKPTPTWCKPYHYDACIFLKNSIAKINGTEDHSYIYIHDIYVQKQFDCIIQKIYQHILLLLSWTNYYTIKNLF